MRKSLVFVVLGIPVVIAVILKFFGDNQYDIPVYYAQGVSSVECNIDIENQYLVEELQTVDGNSISWRDRINICCFKTDSNDQSIQIIQELARVFSTNRDPELLRIYTLGEKIEPGNHRDVVQYIELEQNTLDQTAKCGFLVSENQKENLFPLYNTIVLIDELGRIRGYYDGSEPEEYDRLSAEVDILKLGMSEN